ncbi:MAG: alpha/beta hydrolase family protein [Ignavibacteriaceae bacterium]
MKSIISSFIAGIIFMLPLNLYSQVSRGIVKEGVIIQSKILNKEVRYTIYLPYDYETSSRYYPVVYLLHGYSDNDMGWIQFGEANTIADEGIANRQITPMILVMPDGGVSWYMNNYDNSVRYEDFFFQEFVPYIESHYRIRAEKRYRGIAGLSMGGNGTLLYSFKHPDMFAACAAFSVGVRTDEEVIVHDSADWEKTFGNVFGHNLFGKDRLTDHYYSNNLFYLIKNTSADKLKSVRIYIDCGDKDFLYKGNSALHVMLRDYNIPHEYRTREGGHQWSYWRSGLLDALKFIGTSFHQD